MSPLKLFYFNCSNLSPGGRLYHLESTSFVHLNYFPWKKTDKSLHPTKRSERTRNQICPLDSVLIGPSRTESAFCSQWSKNPGFEKDDSSAKHKVELSRGTGASEMRPSGETGAEVRAKDATG